MDALNFDNSSTNKITLKEEPEQQSILAKTIAYALQSANRHQLSWRVLKNGISKSLTWRNNTENIMVQNCSQFAQSLREEVLVLKNQSRELSILFCN